jgi:hypothetical protein
MMDRQEFAAWQAMTESSRFHWMEDEIYRLNGRGAMYHIGGEDGIYLRIGKDGLLDVGTYEGAVPHIGEAVFRSVRQEQHGSFSDAFAAAMKLGGRQFLVDMFNGNQQAAGEAAHQAYCRIEATSDKTPREKPSALAQIREAKTQPPEPRKQKEHGRDVDGLEL